jgi:tRNA(Ile)-lysidine synthase
VNKLPNAIAVTAHHKDDQLETFWLHLVRNSGLSGLSGMREATSEILRPFLGISRKTIERYALKHQIPFREDRSNAEIKYLRNFFRLEALPYLYHTHPSLKKNLLFLLSVLKKSYANTKHEAQRLAQNWKEKQLILLEETELDPTLLVEALKEIQVEPRFLKSILELTHSEHGKQVQVSGTLAIVRTSMGLQLNYLEQAIPMKFTTQTVHTLPSAFDNWNWYLNPEQVEQELKLTPFEAHEWIQANGLKREKSINALLKSAGIPEFERKKWPVLRCGDNIVGVPGVAIAHSFRADTNGNSFLKVTFKRC